VALIFRGWMESEPSLSQAFRRAAASPQMQGVEKAGAIAKVEALVSAVLDDDPSAHRALVGAFLRAVTVEGPWARVYDAVDAPALAGIAEAASQERYNIGWKKP
jgi:hypothetical protein